MDNFGCFVNLTSDCNYSGDSVSLRGPLTNGTMKFANFNNLAGSGKNWDNKASSLTTGDSTWAELYRGSDYGGAMLRIGPNTAIRDLRDYYTGKDGEEVSFEKDLSSMIVHDHCPPDWTGPATEKHRGAILSDLHKASVNRKVKKAVTGVIDLVPTVGGVISGILGVLWPTEIVGAQTMRDMEVWMSDLLQGVVTDVTNHIYANRILGLVALLRQYDSDPTAEKFAAVHDMVVFLEPSFLNPPKGADSSYFITIFGTLALTIYRLDHFCYQAIHGTAPSEAQKKNTLDKLQGSMAALRDAVKAQYAAARARRLDKVVALQKENWPDPGWWRAQDSYTDWRTPEFLYSNFPYTKYYDKSAEAMGKANVPYFQDRYAAPTFDADFDVYLEVADVWTWFDQPDAPGKNLPTARRTVTMGGWGRPWTPPTDDKYKGKHKDFSVSIPAGKHLKRVALYGGKFVDGLEIEIEGQLGESWGKVRDKKQSSQVIQLAADQAITGAFGGWGESIDHVSFRVQTSGTDGAPGAWPGEPGLGHSSGGLPFASSGPDGAGAALSGFFGQVDEDGMLAAVGFYWSYDRIQPRG
jgi:hypothetical protein